MEKFLAGCEKLFLKEDLITALIFSQMNNRI